MTHPFSVVEDFEKALAEYTGAPYAVTTDSCTNAIFLSLLLEKARGCDTVDLPKRTYIGVAMAAKNAGYRITFRNDHWNGVYRLQGTRVMDAAKRFQRRMYIPETLMCLSFQAYKHLPIGRGGAILLESLNEAVLLEKMRFDGRTPGERLQHPTTFDVPGYHMYMDPERAARGLWLLSAAKDRYPDQEDEYQDLSLIPLFKT